MTFWIRAQLLFYEVNFNLNPDSNSKEENNANPASKHSNAIKQIFNTTKK